MPGRRLIVFVGNCQLDALARLYRRVAAPPEDEVVYLASYQAADAAQRARVAQADVLLRQVLDFAPVVGELETSAKVHLVPHIGAAFLWPCTGSAHPRNAPAPFLDESGPYPAELGDFFSTGCLRPACRRKTPRKPTWPPTSPASGMPGGWPKSCWNDNATVTGSATPGSPT